MHLETMKPKAKKSTSGRGHDDEKGGAAANLIVTVEKTKLEAVAAETLVVFATTKADAKAKKDKGSNILGVAKEVQEKLTSGRAVSGAAQECVLFREFGFGQSKNILVVGLGDTKSITAEALRQAAAVAMGGLKSSKSTSAALALDSIPGSLAADVVAQAITEGLLLGAYSFSEFKTGKKEEGLETAVLVSSKKNRAVEKAVEDGSIVAECVNFSRWLGDRPGNRMTPSILAEEAVKAAKGTKLKVSVWDRAKIKAEKMNSFLSVSLGSDAEPKFIVMEYRGAGASKKPVCFVGKGLTFDCGGISIKPSAGMEEMKYDMCGGANVIGTMLAIAKLRLKVNVIGLVPSTENMPGPLANKPGDIVIARNGKSIEVNNTDAEGRLILNDALVYGCEQKPAAIFDIATLTGAMVVALGNIHTGYFTRSAKLAKTIDGIADKTGELVWRMPLVDFHGRDMKGTYADLSNISSGKGAGSATAAAFLENFVDKDIPWAHFDIAGTGWHSGDRFAYNPRKGATGVMIRTFIQLAQAF